MGSVKEDAIVESDVDIIQENHIYYVCIYFFL